MANLFASIQLGFLAVLYSIEIICFIIPQKPNKGKGYFQKIIKFINLTRQKFQRVLGFVTVTCWTVAMRLISTR